MTPAPGDPAAADAPARPAAAGTASGRRALASPTLGLRERKKIKTRLAIQHHALRLIREQGYEGTTVEQIAEAAEISPSTFFRYFPTKDAVVLTDDFDPLLIEALRAQPADLGVVRAMRTAYRQMFGELSPEDRESFLERSQVITQVTELRAAFLDAIVESIDLIVGIVVERTGRTADDPMVRALAGALMGTAITEFLHWSRHPETDFTANLDRALATLEASFPW